MAFDPTREGQLSEDKLKMGYWWVTHKVMVRKAFSVVLGIVGGLMLAYGGFGFLDWFFGSGVRERAEMGSMTKQWIDYGAFREAGAPKPLVIDDAVMLESGDKTYDFYSTVSNSNLRWWIELEYQFDAAGADIKPSKAYVLPGETKALYALGVKSDSRPGGPSITIINFAWHKVNPHMVQPDYATWAQARLRFSIEDVVYAPPAATDQIAISRASFKVTNDTAYSYWNVGFFVTLYSGNRVAGINYVTISELRSGDERTVEASWFGELPSISRVEVAPEVNIFDDRAYIAVGR